MGYQRWNFDYIKKTNIVLIGLIGGKTSVGRLVGKKLWLKSVDIDSEIEKDTGLKIRQYA